jgi:hypothetical protein
MASTNIRTNHLCYFEFFVVNVFILDYSVYFPILCFQKLGFFFYFLGRFLLEFTLKKENPPIHFFPNYFSIPTVLESGLPKLDSVSSKSLGELAP